MAKIINILLFLLSLSLISCKSAEDIAECAMVQLGKTYKAGERGEDHFDNNGLISYCHDVNSLSELQNLRPGDGSTGDIIYFEEPSTRTLCKGIVTGNGQAITIFPNNVVQYISYFRSPYYESRIKEFKRAWDSSRFGASNSPYDQTGINILDVNYYKKKYKDVSTLNDYYANEHWYTVGKKEGRSPCIYYDPIFYLNNNPDIKNAVGNDYVELYTQFVEGGINEYRSSSPVYDGTYYKNHNSDLKNLYSSQLINHFLNKGMKEGRQSSQRFDVKSFMNSRNDLKVVYGNDYEKYYYYYMFNYKN